MPKQKGPLSAVVVSGGKQYRVAPGDQILVDRLAADPGAELALGRVLLVADGDDVRVGVPTVEGVTVGVRVVAHRRGPKIDVLRYKSKKRVRVHRGARADLTAIEILSVGGDGGGARAAKPGAAKADAAQPGAAQPGAAKPGADQPGTRSAATRRPARKKAAEQPEGGD